MKIKTFMGRVNVSGDFDSLETRVNQFVNNKNVIGIKQSLSPSESNGSTTHHLLVITVMYE